VLKADEQARIKDCSWRWVKPSIKHLKPPAMSDVIDALVPLHAASPLRFPLRKKTSSKSVRPSSVCTIPLSPT
jgi:hypothetical protein